MQPLSSRQFKFNLQVSFSNITLHKYNERNGMDEIYSKDNPLFYAFLSVWSTNFHIQDAIFIVKMI